MARKPKLSGAFATIVKEPSDKAEGGENTKDNDVGESWKKSTVCEDGDEEDGGAEQEEVHKRNARYEGGGELFCAGADVFAEGSVIEQKQSAKRELERSSD